MSETVSVLYHRWEALLKAYGVPNTILPTAISMLAEAVDEELIGKENDQSADWIRQNPIAWANIQARAQLRRELSGVIDELILDEDE